MRGGQSEWLECHAQFETDAAVQEELSRNTFDMVRSARCQGTIRVLRTALVTAILRNDVLKLDPQAVTCSVTTSGNGESQVALTLAPQVSFQAGRIADISPRLISISNLPEFLVAPLRAAAESEFVREQLTNGLNAYLDQALGR
jgi:hypothetical protein